MYSCTTLSLLQIKIHKKPVLVMFVFVKKDRGIGGIWVITPRVIPTITQAQL